MTQPDVALNDNRVIQGQVSIHLGQIVNLDIAMDEKAKFVAVAVLFRIPGRTRGTWKRVLSRDDLDPDEPQVVDVRDNTLILRSSK
ncbi:type VI secretion lipoprotein TssJ [Yersinia wautersii]|uniref:type VI secretion lipoprotein TssJ n=1 Tax=Yersinia wautersii TaxID=1341643 RepID=UPI0009070608|nr:type VI secretion lipoprotein TssJ [Yersinia wautersii]